MTPTARTTLSTRRLARANGDGGFTLIELLVVVIIIGILAAIAIPIYIGVQNSAKDAAAKSDVTNGKTAEVAYSNDNGGAYTSTDSALASYGYTTSTGTHAASITLDSADSTKFCVSVESATGTWYAATESSGVGQGYCGLYAVFVSGQPG